MELHPLALEAELPTLRMIEFIIWIPLGFISKAILSNQLKIFAILLPHPIQGQQML